MANRWRLWKQRTEPKAGTGNEPLYSGEGIRNGAIALTACAVQNRPLRRHQFVPKRHFRSLLVCQPRLLPVSLSARYGLGQFRAHRSMTAPAQRTVIVARDAPNAAAFDFVSTTTSVCLWKEWRNPFKRNSFTRRAKTTSERASERERERGGHFPFLTIENH